eukprot:GDKJ01058659.1.p1 GENE.GDKJ01058659.1~~GDKJ01058659.1.p1  ORF type:complete len:374 (+),score=110.11 GDKJ01058659.1:159-1124(+)
MISKSLVLFKKGDELPSPLCSPFFEKNSSFSYYNQKGSHQNLMHQQNFNGHQMTPPPIALLPPPTQPVASCPPCFPPSYFPPANFGDSPPRQPPSANYYAKSVASSVRTSPSMTSRSQPRAQNRMFALRSFPHPPSPHPSPINNLCELHELLIRHDDLSSKFDEPTANRIRDWQSLRSRATPFETSVSVFPKEEEFLRTWFAKYSDHAIVDLLIDFLSKCLKWDPRERMTMQDALCHPLLAFPYANANLSLAQPAQTAAHQSIQQAIDKFESKRLSTPPLLPSSVSSCAPSPLASQSASPLFHPTRSQPSASNVHSLPLDV